MLDVVASDAPADERASVHAEQQQGASVDPKKFEWTAEKRVRFDAFLCEKRKNFVLTLAVAFIALLLAVSGVAFARLFGLCACVRAHHFAMLVRSRRHSCPPRTHSSPTGRIRLLLPPAPYPPPSVSAA